RSVPGPAMIEGAKQMGWPVPETVVDGEVLEADPPHRLVQTWRMAMDPQAAAEGFTRLTYEITEGGGAGVCRLTVTHEVGAAPSVCPRCRTSTTMCGSSQCAPTESGRGTGGSKGEPRRVTVASACRSQL